MIVVSILTGVAASLAASGLFLWVLVHFKPKIEISQYIADISTDSDPRFAFKIINKTKSTIFDVKVQALLINPVQVHGGPVNDVYELSLIKDDFFEMGPFDKKDKDAHYALRFGTTDDLNSLWSQDTQYLRLNVVSRHAISGFSNVASVIFNTKGIIKKGKHVFGEGMDVQ